MKNRERIETNFRSVSQILEFDGKKNVDTFLTLRRFYEQICFLALPFTAMKNNLVFIYYIIKLRTIVSKKAAEARLAVVKPMSNRTDTKVNLVCLRTENSTENCFALPFRKLWARKRSLDQSH